MTETTDLVAGDEEQSKQLDVLAEAQKADAVQRVQAALVIAKKFPRNEIEAITKIKSTCERHSLAAVAMYKYPRGGEMVKGASIRLAEVLAQRWGNMDYGMRELEQGKDDAGTFSVVEAFAWDMESNTRSSRTFKVNHRVQTKKHGMKYLTDPRDIYEHVANQASRRTRSAILAVIPRDVQEQALKTVHETLARGEGNKTIKQRIEEMVAAFDRIQIPLEALEQYLGHKAAETIAEELVDLQAIYNSLKDGASKRSDWFKYFETTDDSRGAKLTDEVTTKQKSKS